MHVHARILIYKEALNKVDIVINESGLCSLKRRKEKTNHFYADPVWVCSVLTFFFVFLFCFVLFFLNTIELGNCTIVNQDRTEEKSLFYRKRKQETVPTEK